jgi:serine/threonine protein kinase
MVEKGARLGKFEILDKLGAGGMADVYLAEDTTLRRKVALKMLPPALARNEDLAARFEKEVLHCASLQHPGIVTIYEVGHEQGIHFYTMALLTGGDLKGKIREGIDPSQALAWLRQIAEALAFAHGRGFVHRDLKPENILFDDHGKPVVTDFGIAKAVGSGTRMTGTGMSIGTPHYMSPEQAQGQANLDGRSDLYSLGIVLYETLTGKVPFDAENTVGIAMQHVQGALPQLPGDLGRYQPLLDRLLAKNPTDRYSDASELVVAIDQSLAGNAPASQRRKPAAPKTQLMKTELSSNEQKGSGLKWAAGGALLAVLLVGGFLLTSGSNKLRLAIGGGGSISSSPANAQIPLDPPELRTGGGGRHRQGRSDSAGDQRAFGGRGLSG